MRKTRRLSALGFGLWPALGALALASASLSGAGNASRLSAAIQAGDRQAALTLLKQPAEVTSVDPDGTTPLPMDINPRVVFERMFGPTGSPAQRAARIRDERSMLDSVSAEARQLQRGLGVRDRQRVTEYLDNLREIERRIQRTESRNATNVTLDTPVGVPDSFEDHVNLMYDLLAVAYQADVTRVFTFMLSRELSQRTYPNIGVTEQHHTVSHHGNDAQKIGQNVKVNTYHMTLFARFLDKLRALPDGDGSVLDHSLIIYGGGMGNPNGHASDPLPCVAVGGGVGKGNRHIQVKKQTPVGNLWLSVANQFGSRIETFGDSNGRVEDFFA